jgi:hypothetical protein
VWGNNWVDQAAVRGAQEDSTVIDRRALTGVRSATVAATPQHVTAIPFRAGAGAGAGGPVGGSATGTAPPVRRVGQQSDIRSWFGF